MRVLQVINAFYPPYSGGGAAHVAHNISKALVGKGHEVTVYTTNALSRESLFDPKQNPYNEDGVEVFYFRNIIYKPQIHIYFSKEFVEAVKKSIAKYDTLHLHEYRSYISLVTSYYAKKYDVPYILQAHGQLPRIMAKQRLKWIYDVLFGYRLLRDASKVIALSRMEAEQYRGMDVPEEKIAIIPNGIYLSEYANLPPKGSFKKKFNIDKDEKIVLYLGRIHKSKGIDFLIKAYAHLTNDLKSRDALLVIAGPDDGHLGEAKSLVSALGVSDRVLFTGLLSEEEKINAYLDASICTYLSPYEPFGLVPLEAAVCRTPVVVSSGTPMADIVDKGTFGLSAKYGDINKLAEIMGRMLNNDRFLREMGQRGRKFIFENFNWSKIVDKFGKLYEQVAKEGRSA